MKNIIKKLLRESLNYLVEYSTNKEWNEWLKKPIKCSCKSS